MSDPADYFNAKVFFTVLGVDNQAGSKLLAESYQNFYRAFERFNRIAWGGTLPWCVLRFYRGRGGRTLAYASCQLPYSISFNLSRCTRLPESFIWGVLAHEMTHIWQFNLGRRGGHGKDFHAEMFRIGVDEKAGLVLPNTPANYIFSLNEMFPVSLYNSIHNIHKYSSFSSVETIMFFYINRK